MCVLVCIYHTHMCIYTCIYIIIYIYEPERIVHNNFNNFNEQNAYANNLETTRSLASSMRTSVISLI